MSDQEINIERAMLCISTDGRGQSFLAEASEQGCNVVLLTLHELENADWPREALTDMILMPSDQTAEQIKTHVSYFARHHHILSVVALSPKDAEIAAVLREHMRLSGMGHSTTRVFSDRLAMRMRAERSEVPTAAFSPIFNYDDLRAFMDRIPGPWLLTPRQVASREPSRLIERPQALWRILDELGDTQSDYILEQALDGTVFSVESVIWDGATHFQRALRISPDQAMEPIRPQALQTVGSESLEGRYVLGTNSDVLGALGIHAGVAHTRFLLSPEDGHFYFLDTRACVGPELSTRTVAAATGIDLWLEWARIEAALLQNEDYHLIQIQQEHLAAGFVLVEGDARHFDVPELCERIGGRRAAIIRTLSADRLKELWPELYL